MNSPILDANAFIFIALVLSLFLVELKGYPRNSYSLIWTI